MYGQALLEQGKAAPNPLKGWTALRALYAEVRARMMLACEEDGDREDSLQVDLRRHLLLSWYPAGRNLTQFVARTAEKPMCHIVSVTGNGKL